MALVFVAALCVTIWPEFSVAQSQKQIGRGADLIGHWNLTSVTCYSDHKTYSSKGWMLTIDAHHFSSDISARCDLKYTLNYQTNQNQLLLKPGKAYQVCNGVSSIINVEATQISFQHEGQKLWLELNNSFCHSLARYQFEKSLK